MECVRRGAAPPGLGAPAPRGRVAALRAAASRAPEQPSPDLTTRRAALGLLSAAVAAGALPAGPAAAAAAVSLAARFEAPPDRLTQPPYLAPWDPKTVFYPRWMFGEWRVRSKFTAVAIPLGPKFVPPGFLQAAQASPDDGGVGSEYAYNLRFYSTLPDTFDNNARVLLGLGAPRDAIIADKAFNTKAMSSAFLGYPGAVASVEHDPRDAPLRQTVTLSSLGPDMAPLPPRRLELYVNALQSETDADTGAFRTSELARQVLVAVRDVQVTDYEVVNEYRSVGEGKVVGRQRSLLYLHPQEPLYFRAQFHPVALFDYEFEMQRLPAPGDAPLGAVACVLTPKDVNQCV